MENNKVKNENYILIQGWMLNELALKNNELLIYSIIYGFSQTTGTEFTGSLQYLADWCSCTKQGVIKCLKSLISKNLIIKKETFNNGVKFCTYSINLDRLTEFSTTKQSLVPTKQSLTPPAKQSLTNNININNIDNNIDLKEKIFNKKEVSLFSNLNRECVSQKENKRRINPLPPNKKNLGPNDRNWVDYITIIADKPIIDSEVF